MAPPTAAPTPTQPVPPAAPAHTVETEAQSPAANTAPRPPRARPEPEIQTNIGLKYPVRDLLDRIGMVEGRNIKTVVAAAILEYAKNHGID
ncbi:hypothetical protein ASF30_11690 [Leifsonia sp. Leaf264]|nr:hypothetical protein ASF30_11690 [Leifsonia sp. Leaf264]